MFVDITTTIRVKKKKTTVIINTPHIWNKKSDHAGDFSYENSTWVQKSSNLKTIHWTSCEQNVNEMY